MQPVQRHNHDGINSEKIRLVDVIAEASTLTAADNSGLTAGGVGSLTTADSTIIGNMRTRINEIETLLRQNKLIQ